MLTLPCARMILMQLAMGSCFRPVLSSGRLGAWVNRTGDESLDLSANEKRSATLGPERVWP
jgi:hypothetical protein